MLRLEHLGLRFVLLQMLDKNPGLYPAEFINISHDISSRGDIMPSIKIDKLLVVYTFSKVM